MLENYSEIFQIDVTQIDNHQVLFDYTDIVIRESIDRLRDILIPIVPKYLKIDNKIGFISGQDDLKYDILITLSSCQRTYEIEDVLFAVKAKLKTSRFLDELNGISVVINNTKYSLYKHQREDIGDNFMFT